MVIGLGSMIGAGIFAALAPGCRGCRVGAASGPGPGRGSRVLGALDTYAVTQVEVGMRVAVVGFLVPVVWAACVFVAAYVAAASAEPLDASRHDVLGLTAVLVKRRPVRSLLTPLMLVALAPVVLLPPLTVAVGLSLPGWFMGEWFGVAAWRRRLDPDPEDPPDPGYPSR